MPIGEDGTKSQNVSTKITNSLLPTSYQKNGGAASMPGAADLNQEDEQETEELDVVAQSTSNYT